MNGIFLSLLENGITAGWLVLAVLVLRVLLKRAPKWAVCLLWLPVGLRLMWPYEIESPVSLVPDTKPVLDTLQTQLTKAADTTIVEEVAQPMTAPQFPMVSAPATDLWEILAGIWFIGMAVLLIYMLIGCLRINRQVQSALPLEDNIYLGEGCSLSFVWGLVEPKIYLPAALSEKDRPYVIAHEQTHIRRGDHWWKALGFLLLAVYWFHPLLWLGYILFSRDMELACDEATVRTLDREDRAGYAQALLMCSSGGKRYPLRLLAFGEVSVKTRVRAVLSGKKPILWLLVCAVVLCAVLTVCFLTEPVEEMTTAKAAQTLADSAIWNYEEVTFTVPDHTPKDWVWQIDAVAVGFGMNDTQSMDGELKPGKSYSLPVMKEALVLHFQVKLTSPDGNSVYTEHYFDIGPVVALLPGERYILDGCIYLNPLSSQLPYEKGTIYFAVGEEVLEFTYPNRAISQPDHYMWERRSTVGRKWKPFDLSAEGWSGMFKPSGIGTISIHDYYDDIQMFELSSGDYFLFLRNRDTRESQLWYVQTAANPQMGEYIWSIYSFRFATTKEREKMVFYGDEFQEGEN